MHWVFHIFSTFYPIHIKLKLKIHIVKWSNTSISNNSVEHKSFVCSQFDYQTALFDPLIWLQARVQLGAMIMKGYSTFPKAPALQELHHQIVLYHIQNRCFYFNKEGFLWSEHFIVILRIWMIKIWFSVLIKNV